ncbi:IS481 family transposase [Mycolicibacterium stellerae]|uniref:IS481 family transposase n=1 Tax=Mycolicibacterium stellerae TaxID=2358193 RepID=UPI000F0B29D8|nr:IS481 family transposase [Mycolicibacterium stellerae]
MPKQELPESDSDFATRVTVETRLRAVTEVNDGAPVGEVAERFGVSRQTITAWRKRYEAGGLDALVDQSRRPHSSPGRIAPDAEALICEVRRHHRRWGARRIAYEMTREIGNQAPSRSTTHRVLVRNGLVNSQEQQHKRVYKRWARETPMHLWQLDIVGGVFLVSGREHKVLTAIDDHSRFVVAATVLLLPSGPAVCDAFLAAIARWGAPFEVLTDNGKQFTGKFTRPLPVEALFERICREHGITARLTKRRSPTTTGKIERFHRTLRRELLDETGAFESIKAAQAAIDEWVHAYNTVRPHQSLDMATPASLFRSQATQPDPPSAAASAGPDEDFSSPPLTAPPAVNTAPLPIEMDARVPPSGVVVIAGLQQIWVGKNYAGLTVTLWIHLTCIHILLAEDVIKTVPSRVTTADLQRLSLRGVRIGRSDPAGTAPIVVGASRRPTPIELERTANRDGIVVVRGQELALGTATAGTRVTLRFDAGLIHATAGNMLLKTLSNPFSWDEIRLIRGARPATSALPAPPPAGPQSVQRRVPKDGVVMVAGQRLRVGRTHAGTIVTVVVEDHHFRVLDGIAELSLHGRTSTKPIRNFNATRHQQR